MPLNSLVNLIVVLVLIYVGRIQELIPGLALLSIGKVAVILVLVLYFFSDKEEQLKQPLFIYPQAKYIAIIAVLSVLSIPGSVWQGKSFDFVFSFYSKLLLFVYLMVMVLYKEAHLRKVCLGLSLSALALSVAAVINPRIVEAGRISASGTYDANDFALLLVMCLPVMFYLWEEESGILKHFLLATMLLSLYVIPKTGSRGGLLALVAVVLAVLIKKGSRRFFQGAIVAAAVAAIFYYAAGNQLERLMTVSDLDTDYNQTAQEGRVQIWKRTSKLIVQHPLLGSGAGAFVTAEGQTHEGGKWSSAHNSFIQIGVELGVVGLLAHVWIIWKMIVIARKKNDKYSSGIEVAMYAYIVGGMFLSWAFAYLFYFFIGLSLAKSRIDDTEFVAAGEA